MARRAAQPAPDPAKDPAAYAVFRLRARVPRETILAELEAAGVDRVQASGLLHEVVQKIRAIQAEERVTPNALARGLIAAGAAAILGGILWGVIVIVTDYEIGFMATGIGLLTGYATARLARAKGLPLQLIAVSAALVGIFIGKYLTFYDALRQFVTEDYGRAAAAQVLWFDPEVFGLFLQNLGSLLSPYDILWVALAVLAAWRIPKALDIRLADMA
jgi:hypothetical protein